MQNDMSVGQDVGEESATMVSQNRQDLDAASPVDMPSRLTNGSSETQESMAEPELLALIIELRLRAGRTSSKDKSKSSSGSESTTSAFDTLDLCHRKIEKLPYDMVNIIKDDVVRMALGYNLITSLPSNFIDLAQLRYLNIRANLMSTFPSVLCTLPCLEILDISRNKIRKLPSEPGRLLDLRVLSLANNRIRKLPVWLSRLKELRLLKLEGNPISWPPPHISVLPHLGKATKTESDETQADSEKELLSKKAEDRYMSQWISKLKLWIEENKDKIKSDEIEPKSRLKSPEEGQRGPMEPSIVIGETILPKMSAKSPISPPKSNFNSEVMKGNNFEPQTQGDSKRSIGATFLNIQGEGQSEDEKDQSDEVIVLPAKLHVETRARSPPVVETKTKTVPELSEERKVTSEPRQASPEQVREADRVVRSASIASSLALQQATQVIESVPDGTLEAPSLPVHHGKNNSLSTMQSSSSLLSNNSGNPATALRRGLIRNKKSLPDLRQSQGLVISDRSEGGDAGPSLLSGEAPQRRKGPSVNVNRRPPMPQTSSESAASALVSRGVSGDVWPSNAANGSDCAAYASGEDKPATSMAISSIQVAPMDAGTVEVERNSYFRRLSTLPASTISKSISVPILQCVDATRGILYALSQTHSALKQYITFATDERMTSQLSRALDIASRSMAGLIDSLDRFDSLSRIKGGPLNPIIVRGVLTSCSESVITFRKIVSLLQLQLKSLQSGADIRYTRTLLLLLYGSLGEIHHSWMVMEPLFKDVLPYLQGHEESSSTSVTTAPSILTGQPYTLPSIAEASSPISSNNARFGTTQARPLRRRHAGSFSAQDVAQGASMIPSVPLPSHGYEEIRKAQRPAALGPFPAPSRLGMYQVQQGDIDGGDLLDSSQLTPMESITPKERSRRVPEDSSRRTLSNTSGGNLSAKSHFAVNHQAYPSEVVEAVVDDHLVLLLVKVTSIAYSVWASINDHLNSLGIPTAGRSAIKASAPRHTTPDHTPLLISEGFVAASPHTPARVIRLEGSSSSTIMQDQLAENMSPKNEILPLPSHEAAAAQLSSNTLNKLRNLRDSTRLIIDQTNRLESCCDKVQERSGIRSPAMNSNGDTPDPTFKNIFAESSSFIKSILHISHFIKSVSTEHQFPKSIKVNLAQLTTCARDLTLHLHFLGGSASQAAANVVASPKQQQQQQRLVKD